MNREVIMQALFAKLTAPPLVFNFVADVKQGDVTLTNVSDTSGLFVGMPLGGQGVADGATIATMTPSVTMSLPGASTVAGAQLIQGFRTTGRRPQRVEDTPDQPAMFLVDGNNHYAPRPQQASPKVTLRPEIWIYSRAGDDPDVVPASSLNPMLDAIDTALTPANASTGVWQNLGLAGVIYARIEGEIEYAPGYMVGQAVAIVPLVIEVAQPFPTQPLPAR